MVRVSVLEGELPLPPLTLACIVCGVDDGPLTLNVRVNAALAAIARAGLPVDWQVKLAATGLHDQPAPGGVMLCGARPELTVNVTVTWRVVGPAPLLAVAVLVTVSGEVAATLNVTTMFEKLCVAVLTTVVVQITWVAVEVPQVQS